MDLPADPLRGFIEGSGPARMLSWQELLPGIGNTGTPPAGTDCFITSRSVGQQPSVDRRL
jgi:hypothetical protein